MEEHRKFVTEERKYLNKQRHNCNKNLDNFYMEIDGKVCHGLLVNFGCFGNLQIYPSRFFQCYVITRSVLVNTVREQFAKVREQCSPNPLFPLSGEHCLSTICQSS